MPAVPRAMASLAPPAQHLSSELFGPELFQEDWRDFVASVDCHCRFFGWRSSVATQTSACPPLLRRTVRAQLPQPQLGSLERPIASLSNRCKLCAMECDEVVSSSRPQCPLRRGGVRDRLGPSAHLLSRGNSAFWRCRMLRVMRRQCPHPHMPKRCSSRLLCDVGSAHALVFSPLAESGHFEAAAMLTYSALPGAIRSATRVSPRLARLLTSRAAMLLSTWRLSSLPSRLAFLEIARHCGVGRGVAPSSGHRGVMWKTQAGKWQAIAKVKGEQKFLGYFVCAGQAARAYDDYSQLGYFDCVAPPLEHPHFE